MECAAKGRGTRCVGPPIRQCSRCEAVAYCSLSHQGNVVCLKSNSGGEFPIFLSRPKSHLGDVNGVENKIEILDAVLRVTGRMDAYRRVRLIKILHRSDHQNECERLEQQLRSANTVNEFPFTFCEEATTEICEKKGGRCSFLDRRGLHQRGMWSYECSCRASDVPDKLQVLIKCWNLSSVSAPCTETVSPLSKQLSCWKEYYDWRSIPLHSPVALLLQWPLTVYHAVQLNAHRMPSCKAKKIINIHYLGPDKELSQLAAFGELLALLPQYHVHIELVGPAVPRHRDGEEISMDSFAYCDDRDCKCKMPSETKSSKLTLRLLKGVYHDRFKDIMKDCFPDLIVAPNAGIAAYPNWKETIELIHLLNVPAMFTDFCEEAAHLAAACLSNITDCELALPIELNPFRQPLAIEDSVLHVPCYSNCVSFGI